MIQIDIPMPKTCYECPCHDGEYGRCQITGNSYYDEIPRSCPCREIQSTRQERKKGKWIRCDPDGFGNMLKCSECEARIDINEKYRNFFCYHCGARMDGEQE